MYFPFLKLQKWLKRSAEIRRRNCAVLPIETLDEKDSALSYQDAANLLITPILFAGQKLTDDSQNMNYVRTVFEKVLIG